MAPRTIRNPHQPHSKLRRSKSKLRIGIGLLLGVMILIVGSFNVIVRRSLQGDEAIATTVPSVIKTRVMHNAQHIPHNKIRPQNHDAIAVEAKSHKGKDSNIPDGERIQRVKQQIKEIFQIESVKACTQFDKSLDGKLIETFDQDCKLASHLIAHNPLETQVRYVCGQQIDQGGFLSFSNQCGEGSRRFPTDPELHPKPDFQPRVGVIFGGKYGAPEQYDCTVPCDKWGGDSLVNRKRIDNTDWTFQYSMEGSGYYPELTIDKKAWRNNFFYATTSFDSEVPLPYFSWAEYSIQKPGVDYNKVIKGASFIARNCGSVNDRESVVLNLTKILRVDSLSQCLNNAIPPKGLTMENKILVQKEYLFHLAFENTCEDDYITEKLWGTLESGTVPVYYGAPNVKDHAPPNSIISWHDFNDTTKLGEYLLKVAGDQKLYESYHAWRYKPLAESFVKKFNFTHTHSICRMCRWGYARLYGFSWNHSIQNFQDTHIPRKVCVDKGGLVTHPFQERWLSGGNIMLESIAEGDECGSSGPHFQIQNVVSRKIWSHDGVLDVFIEEVLNERLELELQIPITAKMQVKAPNHFVFQDAFSRYTILTRQHVPVLSKMPGLLNIGNLLPGFALRLMIEDVDTFHLDAVNESSYFVQLMTTDFWNPVEYYLVQNATSL